MHDVEKSDFKTELKRNEKEKKRKSQDSSGGGEGIEPFIYFITSGINSKTFKVQENEKRES